MKRLPKPLTSALVVLALCTASEDASATFSIAACEPETGVCGVAVATHNLAVGASVPFAKYGVGAGVSQFETNPCHAPIILEALERGATAQEAVAQAVRRDNECEDGFGPDWRQIAIVAANGDLGAFTGREVGAHVRGTGERYFIVEGNGLASPDVDEIMAAAFKQGDGPLAERLLDALEAGQKAGGQAIGVLSAALLVATPQGWPVDIDLRVDFAHGSAVSELRTLYNANVARQMLFRAERAESEDTARELIQRAVRLAPDWDRVMLRAARLTAKAGNSDEAQTYACRFHELNPTWSAMLTDEFDFARCNRP